MSEFQPPDREEEPDDDKWERWFAQQEKNGYAVISRDEWRDKLDEAARDGYSEGRDDERENCMRLLNWAYSKLVYRSFDNMDDALMMDEIKLMQMGAA